MAITKINTPELFDLGTTNSSLRLPSGDTASRPTNPNTGELRYNTDDNYVEYWDGSKWFQIDYETVVVPCTTDTVQILDETPLESIATYQFNNATTSIPNNTYPATASNQTYTTGEFGNAIEANGSNTRVDISNLNVSTFSAITISAWVYWQSTDAPKVFGGKFGSRTNRQTFEVHGNANRVRYVDNQQSLYDAPITLSTGWHHFVVTDDYNGNHIIYVDGQAVTSNLTVSSTYSANTAATMFYGMRNTGSVSGSETKGIVDQLRIFNTVLPQSAITNLYNETVATASNSYINVPSCIAYYEMSDATDQTGSYDGTPTDVNFNVAGKFGNAGEFNGSSSYVLASSFMPTGSNPRSASAWVKTTISNANMTILFSGSSGSNNAFIFRILNGQLGIAFWGNDHDFTATGLTDGNWHHVVATYDGSAAKVYLDGDLIGTGSAGAVSTNSGNFAIGAYNNGVDALFNGKIDQVRIFNRAITANEVETLYNEVQCIPTIVPSEHFNTVLYTGNGGTQSISSLDFQPDFVWIKSRGSVRNHMLATSVQQQYNYISTNLTNAEATSSARITSLDSNGFTVGSSANVNSNNVDYVAWNWKAGGAAVAAASIAATNATRSANVDAGFSIMKFHTSASTASPPPMNYIEHGLDATPEMVIYKSTSNTGDWRVMHVDNGQKWIELNTTDATAGPFPETIWDNTSTNIGVRSNYAISRDADYIAYAFHSVDGFSKIGSYTGTGASGNSIVTGFEPAFVMVKSSSLSNTNWVMLDNKRAVSSSDVDKWLKANTSDQDDTGADVSFNSNGFTFNLSSNNFNGSGASYIFMAFAADPAPEPVLANSFNTVTYTGNGGTQSVTGVGFQPDWTWIKSRDFSNRNHRLIDSVRGATKLLSSSTTSAEYTENSLTSFNTNGFTIGTAGNQNNTNENYVAWNWKAAELPAINNNGSITSIVSANPAAGFSIVSYTGNGVIPSTYGHGLSETPKVVIVKNRSASSNWTFNFNLTPTGAMFGHLNTAGALSQTTWMGGTSSVVSMLYENGNLQNANGNNYIAYCFAEVAGFSKFGSYSGTGTTLQTIDCGFEPAFVLIKNSNHGNIWTILDNKRNPSDPRNLGLFPSSSQAEYTFPGTPNGVSFVSNGFTLNTNQPEFNQVETGSSGGDYIYMAFANQF